MYRQKGEGLVTNQLVIYMILALIISHLPIIGRYISMINTLIHENGHALAALLVNGKVYSIKLFQNTSGEAVTGRRGWFSSIVISYAGYTFSSVVVYICFMLLNKGLFIGILYGFLVIASLNLLLWIRNIYGVCWLVSFILLCGWIIYSEQAGLQTFFAYFLSCILLIQSVSSAFQIFMLSIVQRKSAGDASSLANYTKLPAVLWGFLFFLQATYVAYIAIRDHVG